MLRIRTYRENLFGGCIYNHLGALLYCLVNSAKPYVSIIAYELQEGAINNKAQKITDYSLDQDYHNF